MKSSRNILSTLGSFATDALAIAGLFGLAIVALQYLNNPFKDLSEPEVKIKPIYEFLPSLHIKYTDGTPAKARIVGIDIKNTKDITDVKFRIKDINYIVRWSIDSNGMSQNEANSIISNLPIGSIQGRDIFGTISRLMPNSETVIELEGVTNQSFSQTSEWFEVSTPSAKVYHGMLSDYMSFRELYYKFNTPSIFSCLFWIITIPLAIIIILSRYKQRKKNKKSEHRVSKRILTHRSTRTLPPLATPSSPHSDSTPPPVAPQSTPPVNSIR